MRDTNALVRRCERLAMDSIRQGGAKHGFGTEALEVFKKMRQGGVVPNEFTFTGVLSACVQVGLVDEAGLLGEAYEVINTMPRQPNVDLCGSFLSSCKLHKQFEMAKRVIEKVMNMVWPENDGGVYTLISDLYVLGDKWEDAERVRQLMLHQNFLSMENEPNDQQIPVALTTVHQFSDDAISALYMHLSDSPGMVLVPTPFDGLGFRSWRRSDLRALSVKNNWVSLLVIASDLQMMQPNYVNGRDAMIW
ncbi:putative DDB1- and CUL4-associated factor 4-like isoform X1 [Capsicum annuum]|nr:putative DDB1- and CUL4-associated factor 4-like isoform X1 [Capsicum annuum]